MLGTDDNTLGYRLLRKESVKSRFHGRQIAIKRAPKMTSFGRPGRRTNSSFGSPNAPDIGSISTKKDVMNGLSIGSSLLACTTYHLKKSHNTGNCCEKAVSPENYRAPEVVRTCIGKEETKKW